MCEDYPCCEHEAGCCPDFDESGRQLNMVCTCGAKLPITSRYSICESCMRDPDDPEQFNDREDFGEDLDPLDDDRDQNNPVESADWDRIYSDPDYDMDHDHSMDY